MGTSVLIPGWIEKELRANFARACRAGRHAAKTEPRAAFAAYLSRQRALRIELTNGATITLPVTLISGLEGARPKDLRAGAAVACTEKALTSICAYPVSLSSLSSGPEWLAELGRIGGRNSSAAKAAAAARKGGRPRTRSRKDSVDS
jgi:hypothetical protein